MDWFRQYHGEVCDPRWLGVARAAGNGVTPGHVFVVWGYLKECASKASPRGMVTSFDAHALADFTGWRLEQITAVVDAIRDRGLIVDGEISDWLEKQPVKLDATNAARQRRHREKLKRALAAAARPDNNGVTPVTNAVRNGVTPTEEKEQSNCDFSDASADSGNPSLKSPTTRTVREQAGAIIDAGGFWAWVADQGIPAHIGIRTMNRGKLTEWLAHGLTDANLAEAMRRAKRKREQQRSQHPVNLGFLACFVDDVIAGVPATAETNTNTGGGYERGDQLSREFAGTR